MRGRRIAVFRTTSSALPVEFYCKHLPGKAGEAFERMDGAAFRRRGKQKSGGRLRAVMAKPAQFARAALDAVDAKEEIDEPADEGHEQDETDPADRRAHIALGQHGVSRRDGHGGELDRGRRRGQMSARNLMTGRLEQGARPSQPICGAGTFGRRHGRARFRDGAPRPDRGRARHRGNNAPCPGNNRPGRHSACREYWRGGRTATGWRSARIPCAD